MTAEEAEMYAQDFAEGLTLDEAKTRARQRADGDEALSTMSFGDEDDVPTDLIREEDEPDEGIYQIGEDIVATGANYDPNETVPNGADASG